MDKLREEMSELEAARESEDVQEELGDLLFAAAMLARKHGLDAEATLSQANAKFMQRFRHMEQQARDRAEQLDKRDLDAWERAWQEAKAAERH